MIGVKILSMLSRRTEELDYDAIKTKYNLDDAMILLFKSFGKKFEEYILGKTILDYGCGNGYQVVVLGKKWADLVVGVEIREGVIPKGDRNVKGLWNRRKG